MKYRKKPVVIDAVQIETDGETPFAAVMAFTKELGVARRVLLQDEKPIALFIQTDEGEMRADPGDWIIRGVEGEFYPCKPSIFEKTYEPAE